MAEKKTKKPQASRKPQRKGTGNSGMKKQKTVEPQASHPTQVVLCGANAYEEKYWLNPVFDKIPDSIKEELRTICILFTQDAGGVFTLVFDEEGHLEAEAFADEEDITYDRVSAALLTGAVRRRREDMFRMLEMYSRICVLHEDAATVLTEEERVL